jgi:hypothetical protein
MQIDQKRNSTLFNKVIILVIMAFSVNFGLSACKPKAQVTALSFETIEQAEWAIGTGKLYEAYEPGMVIISRMDEITNMNGLVTDASIKQLEALDYDQYFALAAFQGWKPGTNYGIRVSRIGRSGNTVNVYAQLHDPKPDEPSGAMVTSPHHLLKVKKTGSWDQNITFNLFSGQKLVASLTHTIP